MMTYSRTLDGLRGVAILLVLLFHFEFILGIGWVGVQLFFVLSGYLITSILLSGKSTSLDFYLKRFYWRRTLRIFPLYFGYILLIVMVFLLAGIPDDLPEMLPFLASYTFNFYPLAETYSFQDFFFTHFWSLSVEEQFYLVWPFIIFFCSRKQLQIVLMLIIFLAPLIRFFIADIMLARGYDLHYTGEIVYRFTLSQLDGFAFGALIPVFSLDKQRFKAGSIFIITTLLIIGLGAFNVYQLSQSGLPVSLSTLGYRIGDLVNFQHVWSYSLFDFLFLLLIVCIINPKPANKKMIDIMLGNRIMVYFGKISYGLYVYHWIIWMAFGKYVSGFFTIKEWGFPLYALLCVGVASISYFFFERPILSLKDKFFTTNNPLPDEQVRTSF